VGFRKARSLVKTGAQVVVIAPEDPADLLPIQDLGLVEVEHKAYETSDVDGAFLVVAATSDSQLNRRIADDARAAGALANAVDDPQACDFITPATVRRGALILAISTCGASPMLAAKIRRQLENQFGPEYSTLVELLSRIRPLVLASKLDEVTRRRLFDYYTNEYFVRLVRDVPSEMMFEEMKGLLELTQEQAGDKPVE
jgi:precorrin-2 dehydrogenase/sirohydrochlorin ferrochelatase